MNQKCFEKGCTNKCEKTLQIALTDRTDFYYLCLFHYNEAIGEIEKINKKINGMNREELLQRYKEICSVQEFEKLLKKLEENPERFFN